MKRISFLLKVAFISLAFASCNPNDDNPSSSQNDDTFAENFGAAVNRDFIGQVVDKDNHPIQGVTVSIGTSTAQTDINGVFIINNANVNQKFAYIQAKKTGYIDGSRAMVPTTGKNNVKIMLLPNTPVATIQSGQSSEVALPSGTKVTFDGAFQDENGNDYSGAVNVAMFHLTTSDENIDKLMPGMLYAQRSNNEEAVLATFGMLNVELKGAAGQKLNIKSGHTAEISMLIDDTQLSTAPSTIPLWHFDETKGYWKEDGIATKVSNKYVGEVSHFSWWNCDTFSSTVSLTVTVVDANGNPVSNAGVQLVVNSTGFTSYIQSTNASGQVSGLVPANQALTMNLYPTSNCGISNTSTIGPFSSDTNLPAVTIDASSAISTQVTGTLLKCNGNNVTNGYVLLKRNNNFSLSTVSNGDFSFNQLYCNDNTEFTLKGVDYESLQTTDSITYNFTPITTAIGNIHACNAVSEFVSYQIDNQPTVILFETIQAGYQSGPNIGFYISAYNQDSTTGNGLSIGSDTNILGTYGPTSSFYIEASQIGYISATTTNTMQYNLNQFGAVGEYIDMTFSGTYNDFNGITHTLTGVAHVLRDF